MKDLPFVIFTAALVCFLGWLWVQAVVMLQYRVAGAVTQVVELGK
jgi:hypothetical protein